MRLMGCGSQDDAVKRPRLMARLSQLMARKTKKLGSDTLGGGRTVGGQFASYATEIFEFDS
jgi:hypothetical protein